MKGDFTKRLRASIGDDRMHLRQQGRVELDSDWNDHVRLRDLLERTQAVHVIGAAGAPKKQRGFVVGPGKTGEPGFSWSPGAAYVGGFWIETVETGYHGQPIKPLRDLPTGRAIVAYLDVWERHVAVAEDASLLDAALRGVDTNTRVRRVWQVKIATLPQGSAGTCADGAAVVAKLAEGTGLLSTSFDAGAASTDPCQLVAGEEYQGVENRLYRVEIHHPGELQGWAPRETLAVTRPGPRKARISHLSLDAAPFSVGQPVELWSASARTLARVVAVQTATVPGVDTAAVSLDLDADVDPLFTSMRRIASFKWSRDNGSVAYAASLSGKELTLAQRGRDGYLALAKGQWVEVLDERRELAELPGFLSRLASEVDDDRRIALADDPPADLGGTSAPRLVRARRWDNFDGLLAGKSGPVPLERGIRVELRGTSTAEPSPAYRTGQHWSFSARTEGTPSPIELRQKAPPDGPVHHRAAIGVRTDAGGWGSCLPSFPPLTEIDAADVSFQNKGACALSGSALAGAKTVEAALQGLCDRFNKLSAREVAFDKSTCDPGVPAVGATVQHALDSLCAQLKALDASKIPVNQAVCGLPAGASVQQVLVELCKRGSGCVLHVRPGADLAAAILSAPGDDLEVELCPGDYRLEKALVIVRKGTVRVRGVGRARLVGPLERLLEVRSASATVEDLWLRSERGAPRAPEIGGVVGFVDCIEARAERLHVTIEDGPGYHDDQRACVLVAGEKRSARAIVTACDVTTTEGAYGILVRDVRDVTVRDNRVRLGPRAAGAKAIRERDRLITALAWGFQIARTKPVVVTNQVVAFPSGPRTYWFRTLPELVEPWKKLLSEGAVPGSAADPFHAVRRAARGRVRAFLQPQGGPIKEVHVPFKKALEAIAGERAAAVGIAVVGRALGSVEVSANEVTRALHGIRVAVGDGDAELPPVERVIVRDNAVHVYVPTGSQQVRGGVFVGSAAHVFVERNRVTVERGAKWERAEVDGVRLWGRFGSFVYLACNELRGATYGIRFVALNGNADGPMNGRKDTVWAARDNAAPGARVAVWQSPTNQSPRRFLDVSNCFPPLASVALPP